MEPKKVFQSLFGALTAPDWIANIVALAALLASLYSIRVSRDIAREQVLREREAKSMQYTLALRFEVPYVPKFINNTEPDLPERPPFLVVPARLFVSNASALPQAFSSVTFSYDGDRYYPLLAVRNANGSPMDWPLNIPPGTSVAFDIDVPLPLVEQQVTAINERLKTLETPIRSWPDFEQRVLMEALIDSKPLTEVISRRTHFWIETLSPSPGFPRKIIFEEWVPGKWRSGPSRPADKEP